MLRQAWQKATEAQRILAPVRAPSRQESNLTQPSTRDKPQDIIDSAQNVPCSRFDAVSSASKFH